MKRKRKRIFLLFIKHLCDISLWKKKERKRERKREYEKKK